MPPKEQLAFGRTFGDHMLTIAYEDGGWKNPKIEAFRDLKISPAASSLHYGEFGCRYYMFDVVHTATKVSVHQSCFIYCYWYGLII